MKKLLLSLLATSALSVALPAAADVVVTLNETFASGAAFTGQLTFTDGYASLLGVDGTLSGAAYGVQHYGWTWNAGNKYTTQDYDGVAATAEDWLMSGNVAGTFDTFIGLSWIIGAPTLSLVLVPNANIYYAGIMSTDATVSATIGAVPEPASLALLGLGTLALGASRRRRA